MTEETPTSTWDLTQLISPHLDLHMMFPLLEYVDTLIAENLIPYSHSDVSSARLSLLQPTHMVDYAMDIFRELHGEDVEIPREMEEQKVKVFERIDELREGCLAFQDLLMDGEEKKRLSQNNQWTVAGLTQSCKKYTITPATISTYRELAKFNYDCGDYQSALAMIKEYLSLYTSPPAPSSNDEDGKDNNTKPNSESEKMGHPQMYYLRDITPDLLRVLWGRLSCEILVAPGKEPSHHALTAVRTAVETLVSRGEMSPLEALEQRTWLLHWSLWVFWNDSSKGLEAMVELFKTERYLQAITTNAPHLLRYLTAAVLLSKRRILKSSSTASGGSDARRLMKELVRVMQQCEYTDPIVEFVECLCVKFDFEMAQKKLAECEAVLATDFFLCKQTALFMEEARVFVFENYCRIHHKIDLAALGEKLAMDQSDAERWIVDLIRNALLDAKIDGEERCVVMGGNSVSVYEQVMEKTRDLNLRSGTMVTNLNNLINEARKEKKKKERAALEEDDEY